MIFLFFLLCASFLFSEKIDTFYGAVEVTEPILLELIKSPPMQRLKGIHQYGVEYYTTHREEYNRYDHSLGVFALLRKNGASLEEQVSGLIHDVSHTVFSHVGDWIFGREYQEVDYQSTIYNLYLSHSGIEEILIKYGMTISKVLPKSPEFIMLEQPLPNLCADRIDYNIQGAFFQNFLTKAECLELYESLHFKNGKWITSKTDLLRKLTRFSLHMTQHCWGGAANYIKSRALADAMIRALDQGLLSWKEIHFGTDQVVWDKLTHSKDPHIQKKMDIIIQPNKHYKMVDSSADIIVKFRCRGIDPWVEHQGQIMRLSAIDPAIAQEFEALKAKANIGWPIKWVELEASR